ncbi:uncharacterized protein BubR1 [Drosophila virilis]|uniref:Mitotic checkpoint serine/threonine-protein kinase BUB1 n=1 Tax=Drosophila virilis TaxID=7244 RepID=B4MDY6_DROVI|nr:uncharacterized protein LOC6635865 [Drosophila virilis]EDW58751.2 uncharacterized protein Dvir_GJ18402 [Drosophila virilis]
MDFDNAKENIQPLASGRNVSLLQASLCQDASQELNAQRKQLELDIKNYTGDDPLEPWYAYICWIEQSYPAGGSNSGLQKVMHKCLTRFEQDERYKQDPRLIKLFIKFMGSQGDQIECYQQMYNSGIGTMLADFYIAWAYSYDLSGNMRKANEIFRLGVDCRAEPLEELKEAQQHFGYTVAQRMLYSEGEETTAVTQELNDRRLALRSLHGQKRKNTLTVGSVRTGAAIRSNMPGVVHNVGASTSRAGRNANRQLEVFNDENADLNVPPPPPIAEPETPADAKSSLRSIIDAARQQENLKEPIAWSKPHKHGKIFASTAAHDPAFPIHVDEKALPPIVDPDGNMLKPFKYPPNFKPKNTSQEPWVTPVTIEDEPDTNTLPCYNKCMLYPRPNMEFSPEEYRAYCWFRRRNEQHPYVLRNEAWWGNGAAFGVRRYPNFASISKPQARDELDAYYKPPAVPSLATLLDKVYNDEEQQEYQLEELLVAKWRQKLITQRGVMDMEETVCLPGEQMPRRKSFFPNLQPGSSRKSIMPRISCVMEEDEDRESEEEQLKQQQQVEKPKTPEPLVMKIWEDPAAEVLPPIPTESVVPTPIPTPIPAIAVTSPPGDKFVMPAPPTRKIEIFEDDAMPPPPPAAVKPAPSVFFDADETCSTQMFNIFIKSQAVSTPKAPQKQAPARQFGTLLKEMPQPPTAAAPAAPLPPASEEPAEPEAAVAAAGQTVSPMLRKQLSTILETSEHGVGATNGTTKSTLTSTTSTTSNTNSTSPSLQATAFVLSSTPGPTRLQRQMVSELSVVGEEPTAAGNFQRLELWEPNAPSVPLLKSLRFQEDKTETVPKPLMACYQEDKTETLPKLPLTLPDMANASKLLLQPSVPQLPTEYDDDDDLCGLFAKTPPKTKAFGSPLYAESSKRMCEQRTPEMFSKSMKHVEPAKRSSFEVFKEESYALSGLKPSSKATSSVNKLAESLMADLSFVPETQQPTALRDGKSQAAAQKKFEIFLDESMPPPPVVPPMMNCTLAETQSETIGPAHLTASFMKDLSSCPLPLPVPVKSPATVAQQNFEIFLDESLPNMPPPPPLALDPMDCTLPETQPQGAAVLDHLETIGPAHLTASFMKDCTELSKCPSPPSTSGNRSTTKTATKSTTKLKFLQDLEKSSTQTESNKAANDYFELNAATEMFASNISMIKNSTLLPETSKRSKSPPKQPAPVAAAAPVPSPTPVVSQPVPLIVLDEPEDDERSIYYKATPLTPKQSNHSWRELSIGTTSKEEFRHRKASFDESVLNSTLASGNVNPFSVDIINSLLDHLEFSMYIEKLPNCQLMGHVKRVAPQSTLQVNGEQFEVHKIIGKGAYGSVFSGIHCKSGKKVAFKQEKPTNYWEYYICLEVHSRLKNDNMIPAYMNIDYALVGNNSSVYISELSDYGSLITVCNKYKKHTSKNMDEHVVMHLCCQLLDIVDHLHALEIIHADIKADNFLLMRPLSVQANELSVQLIDFGVAIDTKLFPPNQTFDYVHNEDAFKCIEMRTQRRWTYQLDLFGLVGVMHVLLFGRYMEVAQRQPSGIWMPKTAFPRYFSRQTWESIFRTLLNVRDCRSMPNLQQLRTLLKSELAEKEKYVEAAITKFNMIMQRNH